jgi:5-phospho-D-xylono-1,4-lactonase
LFQDDPLEIAPTKVQTKMTRRHRAARSAAANTALIVPPMPHEPSEAVITVLGPIAPDKLGVTDAHDHLFLRTPALPGQEFDDADRAIEEVGNAKRGGLQAIVELTPIGCGRRPSGMRAVAETTGVNVVAATGYHRDAHYPQGHWVRDATVEQLAQRIVTDLKEGMHPDDWLTDAPLDPARAGVIKGGASYQHISALEERRLVAAAIGHRGTGAAIMVHTEIGTCAHAIVDLLTREGVRPERIILAHLDRNPDFELHSEVAARGVTLEYDTPGRIKYRPDSQLIDLIESMVAAGHGGRLLIGLDLGQRDYFTAYGGGPGLTYLMDVFVPRLRSRIGEAAVDSILIANAARAFALSGGTPDR